MIEVSTLESLRLEHIQELLRSVGPCITILLPPYRPGEQARSTATVLKSDIQEVVRQLAELKLPDPEVADLLNPLHELCKSAELVGGSHFGRAIFRSTSSPWVRVPVLAFQNGTTKSSDASSIAFPQTGWTGDEPSFQ